jgi:hypothetical protein
MNVVMRTTLPPAALSRTIERMVREVDAAVPVVRLRNMDSVFAESIRRPRLLAQLLALLPDFTIGLAGALAVNRLIASLLWCAADRYCDDRLCDRDDYGRQLAADVARIAAGPERRAQRRVIAEALSYAIRLFS